jgi:uncharacterized protein YgbK (DUF1537 family)
MSGLYLVADDLTGALDSAAAFCGRFGSIPVYLDASHADDDPHAAVDLASRDGDAPAIDDLDPRIVERLATAQIAYKKIDSRLRGHWTIELAALMKSGAFDICVMAPAFPAHGRTTVDGRQLVAAADSSEVVEVIDLVEDLQQVGLRVRRIDRSAISNGASFQVEDVDVLLCDASSDHDLQEIVRSTGLRLPHDRPMLWCGSSGLARAIAEVDAPAAPQLGRPVLTIIGSRHPVALQQVAEAVTRDIIVEAIEDHGLDAAAFRIDDALLHTGACVLTFAFPERTPERAAAVAIATRLQALLPLIRPPSSVIVSGGQTLLGVCRAVDATCLVVDGERSPGAPHSTISGGRWNGVGVWLKSGGFGSSSWLADLVASA